MHHNSIAFVYENYKASEIGQEKEAKDASSIIIVKLYVVAIVTQLCCVIFNWPLLLVIGRCIAPKEG
jgi:hypothetical protein